MTKNVTFSIGTVALIDKIDSETGFFKSIFEPVMGKARTFIPSIKLLMNNKLGQSVSINRILDFTPDEFQELLGFKDNISERTLHPEIASGTLLSTLRQANIGKDEFQKHVK
jgi:hypothetical protein